MADGKAGFYGGITVAPDGIGPGVYFDSHGNFYPQIYAGTPGIGVSGGFSTDTHSLLTEGGVSGGAGGANYSNTLPPGTSGYGLGTPGVGVTYGVDGNQAVQRAQQIPGDAQSTITHYTDPYPDQGTQNPQDLARYDELNGTHTLDDYNKQIYGQPDDSVPPKDWDKHTSGKDDKKKNLKWTPMTGCPTCPEKTEDYPRYPGYKATDGTVTKGHTYYEVK